MAKEKPIASGGIGYKVYVYPNRVVIRYNIFKKTTIPIRRIDQVEVSTLTNRLFIHTENKKHTISFGTDRKAQQIADAIIAQM